MTDWKQKLDLPIFFINPDLKRGLGLELDLPNYHLICTDYHPLIATVRKKGGRVFCLAEGSKLDSGSLNNSGRMLSEKVVQEYIREHAGNDTPRILLFKPSLKADIWCEKLGYEKWVNSSLLNEEFENKISFYKLVTKHFPSFSIPGTVGLMGKLEFLVLVADYGLPLVIQFGHGWAGKTTFFIDNEEAFTRLKQKFIDTEVKATRFIQGQTYLNNCCVYDNKILVSPLARQISAIPELSRESSSTCGRQWAKMELNSDQIRQINLLSKDIGQMMSKKGYRGYFGLDFIIEKRSGAIYVSENNARFTASAPFYTKIELKNEMTPLSVYHLLSFLGEKIPIQILSDLPLATQLDLRNTNLQTIFPENQPRSGFYHLQGTELEYLRENYDIRYLEKEELSIIPSWGKKIKYNEIYARVEVLEEVIGRNGKIRDKYQIVLERLRPKLFHPEAR